MMFGYVIANRKDLSAADKKAYQLAYCGLCNVLGQKYGAIGQLQLSYDMTFLTLLLSDLEDDTVTKGAKRCKVHPLTPRDYAYTSATAYCADMQILLSYFSALDNAQDKDNRSGAKTREKLEPFIKNLATTYPRQYEAITQNLSLIEKKEHENDMDVISNARLFGSLLGEVFAHEPSHWYHRLYAIGEGLGRFIYILDAFDDLKKDQKRGAYNPLSTLSKEPGFSEKVREMLTWAAADASSAFEELPLDEYVSLLRNILYSGIWFHFEAKNKDKK